MRKLLVLALLCPYLSMCQPLSINGKVLNEEMAPVAGATIVLKRTNHTVISNEKGEFYFTELRLHDTLLITAVGYEPAIEKLNFISGNILTVILKRKTSALTEVTINTGYQHLPKERITGSFVYVDNEALSLQYGSTVIDRLEGITNALLFDKSPSRPSLTIRGLSSINGPKDPLIILDNFPYTGDLENINPNDIESITVLKDAAAASIWGTRAGNGVIVLTSRKGRYNQPLKISANTTLGFTEKPDLFHLPLISSTDYIAMEEFLFSKNFYVSQLNSTARPALSPVVELLIKKGAGQLTEAEYQEHIAKFSALDLRDEYSRKIYSTALLQQYAVSASAGSPSANYLLSGGYDKNISSLKAANERYTLKSNATFKPFKTLQLSAGVLLTHSESKTGKPDYSTLTIGGKSIYPYASLLDDRMGALPVYLLRQTYADTAGAGRLLDWKYYPLDDYKHNKTNMLNSGALVNASILYGLPFGLSMEGQFQYNHQQSNSRTLQDIQSYAARDLINRFTQINGLTNALTYIIPPEGILIDRYSRLRSYNAKLQLSHTADFGKISINSIAGAELSESRSSANNYQLYGYNDELGTSANVDFVNRYPNFINGALQSITNVSSVSDQTNRFTSAYFNTAADYDRRYIVSFSLRKDASNLFGVSANERGVPLWSAGAAWNVTRENGFRLPLSELKFRATIGFSGNVDHSRSAVTTIRHSSSATYTNLPYASVIQFPNPSLTWEKVKTLNFGVDFALKSRKVNGSLDFYIKKGSDLFGISPVDYTAVAMQYMVKNAASMKGHGIDLNIEMRLADRTFKWLQELNFNLTKHKVTDYYLNSNQGRTFINSGTVVAPLPGQPVYSIISYNWGGLDPSTGNPMGYLDGQLSTNYTGITSTATIDDLVFSGSATPQVFGNVTNQFSYKNISLLFNIVYKLGYNFRRESISYSSLINNGNGHSDYALRWQKPGDELRTNIPSFIYPLAGSRDAFYNSSNVLVTNGDLIRLQFVKLMYNMRSPNYSAAFFLNMSNPGLLWTANPYNIDPDYPSSVPPSRSIAAGLTVNL